MRNLDLLNADGLDESLIQPLYSKELYSYADGDEQEYEDEDNTEYENEESEYESEGGDDITAAELPKFRELVRNKKLELKAQYGKAKISIGECGIQPIRTESKYNPQVRIPKIYSPFKDCGLNPDLRPEYFPTFCAWDCSKDKNTGKDCCVTNRNKRNNKAAAWAEYSSCRDGQGKLLNSGLENEDAWARAQDRFNADNDAWRRCRSENKGIIVWGWRKRWRDFKRAGGLAQLRMQSKGLAPIPSSTPSIVTPPSTVIPNTSTPQKPKKLESIKGEKLISVPKKLNIDFSKIKDGLRTSKPNEDSDKIFGMSKGLAIGLGIALAIGGFLAYKKFSK